MGMGCRSKGEHLFQNALNRVLKLDFNRPELLADLNREGIGVRVIHGLYP